MFIGTLRYNLDPFDNYSDAEIRGALEMVQLHDYKNKLDMVVEEGGRNLSQGERQLICVARALLRKTQILLLDEASASLDAKSDSVLQEMIRTVFNRFTVLTVAHRLASIADSDQILVIDEGSVVQMGTPEELLNQDDGVFKVLVQHLDEEEREKVIQLAKQKKKKTN